MCRGMSYLVLLNCKMLVTNFNVKWTSICVYNLDIFGIQNQHVIRKEEIALYGARPRTSGTVGTFQHYDKTCKNMPGSFRSFRLNFFVMYNEIYPESLYNKCHISILP